MTPIRSIKSPSEELSYVLRPGGEGFVGDGIASTTISVTGEAGVLAEEEITTIDSVQYRISGGRAGKASVVRVLINTMHNQVHEVEHTVTVVS